MTVGPVHLDKVDFQLEYNLFKFSARKTVQLGNDTSMSVCLELLTVGMFWWNPGRWPPPLVTGSKGEGGQPKKKPHTAHIDLAHPLPIYISMALFGQEAYRTSFTIVERW